MKLDHDAVKEKYIARGDDFGHACGNATRDIKEQICNWRIAGGSVVVIFGAPGSGKSRFISRMRVPDNLLMVETSGLNISLNAFLLSLDEQVEYAFTESSPEECERNIRNRPPRPLDDANHFSNLIALVKTWHKRYNSDWKWKLPQTRKISFVPEAA